MSDDRPWHTFDSEGRCIAWLHSLPDGTRFLLADDGRSDARIAPTAPPMVNAFDRPVVVVAWPDGSTPKPEGAGYEYEVVAADGWVDGGYEFASDALEAAAEYDRSNRGGPHKVIRVASFVIRQEVKS